MTDLSKPRAPASGPPVRSPGAARSVDLGTLGVVVLHKPAGPVADLPAVRDLYDQVDELLLVLNGSGDGAVVPPPEGRHRSIRFPTNRGTAAAWNAALSLALDRGHRYLYLLDQDSSPHHDAVAVAQDHLRERGAVAVVQPARRDRFRLDPFPWNTVASGSLFEVAVLNAVGGFDERLFVDEVDHEVLARLTTAGHRVEQLPCSTIDHATGSPRPIGFMGREVIVSGHSAERRRLQGYSGGVLVRRFVRTAPATSARLLARHALTAAKDLSAGSRSSALTLLTGLAEGLATGRPPTRAADRPCPYCSGVLLGRYGAVPDWRFSAGPPGDVYRCVTCGALAVGRVPDQAEVASWYSAYYTHAPSVPVSTRPWSKLWPTPHRRRERAELRRYCAPEGSAGRFLEVGTGAGERLVEFADAGWDVVGQDPDLNAGHLARARGIIVHRCPVEDLVDREKPFDLIGLNHVLEHALEPRVMLEACGALLTPGGLLCVVSPNAQSVGRILFGRWWFGLEQPRHLAIPTLESMTRVTEGLGLRTKAARSVATNGAVILGGSLDRPFQSHLRAPGLRRISRALTALAGQAIGRAAIRLNPRLGEELVWVGHPAER
jgi:2-polyprenyl-3-methyl-5-hydroxy-6-metoxy-1,4-benzoquinol methylase